MFRDEISVPLTSDPFNSSSSFDYQTSPQVTGCENRCQYTTTRIREDGRRRRPDTFGALASVTKQSVREEMQNVSQP